MDVFLVPVGIERYELYCEHQDHDVAPQEPPRGAAKRVIHTFREMLAEAERERRKEPHERERPRSIAARVKKRTMRWVAESIAGQRLLWQLRKRDAANLFHPDDLSDVHAREILRRSLNADFERHRFWLAIDSLLALGSVALILLPGPNVIGYYFLFRMVGHFLSVRGARNAMVKVAWSVQQSAPLSALRPLIEVPSAERAERVREVAVALKLDHLTSFFQRAATP